MKTFTGTQTQSTPQFVITGPKWRVIIHARATGSRVGRVTVSAKGDEGGEIEVGSVSAPPHERIEGPTVSSDLIDGPDIFSLDIEAEDAEYAVRVCERQVQPTPPSGSSGEELGTEPPPQPPSRPPARTTPGGKGRTPPEESAAQPPPPPSPPPARTTPPVVQPQPSSPSPAPGLNSGGAHSGPLPLMANGDCPQEFPVKKDGACFLR